VALAGSVLVLLTARTREDEAVTNQSGVRLGDDTSMCVDRRGDGVVGIMRLRDQGSGRDGQRVVPLEK
jgi:hypothetical protein